MGEILVLRHAGTVLNDSGQERVRGWLNVPVTPEGLRQSEGPVRSLCRDHAVGMIYTSDMRRATQTAQQVRDACGAPLMTLPGLRPWNNGALQGQPVRNVLAILQALETQFPFTPAPGGEPFATFVYRFLTTFRAIMRGAAQQPKAMVVVTHSRNVDVLVAWVRAGMNGYSLDHEALRRADFLAPGQILMLERKNGAWVINRP